MQKTLTVRVPEGTYEQVVREAESRRIGVADYIRAALAEQLEADHHAERLSALEARLMAKLDQLQNSIDALGIEEA